MKIISNEQIKSEYLKRIKLLQECTKEFDKSCVVFVYNAMSKIANDDLHISECVYDAEIALIEDAFHAIPELRLYSFDSEDEFIEKALYLKKQYKVVYVYSMAQNLNGIGRRCLIPLLCEYYGFVNISSNSASSFLGGNKRLMHELLAPYVKLPRRLFLTEANEISVKKFLKDYQNILLKPNSESASIGISKISSNQNIDEIMWKVKDSINKYKTVILEEFIEGDEVECTILPWNCGIFAAPPVKIVKNTEYLDYKTVAYDNYDFELYGSPLTQYLKKQAIKSYSVLRFDSIARFDFMVANGNAYLFDITPNPTISKCSSANLSTKFINEDDRTIYLILLINKLLIPTLN